MQIFVRVLDCDIILTLDVEASDTIDNVGFLVLAILERDFGFPSAPIFAFLERDFAAPAWYGLGLPHPEHCADALEGGRTFADYGIQNESALHFACA